MQLIFGQERPTDIKDEFDALVMSYWVAENPNHVTHQLDWNTYHILTQAGICRAFTARSGRDELVGCVFYNVVSHPHHLGYVVAEGDMISVNPKYRGLGIAGRLMEYAQPFLVAAGVKEIVHRYKIKYNKTPLFLSQGYEADETVYRKKVA